MQVTRLLTGIIFYFSLVQGGLGASLQYCLISAVNGDISRVAFAGQPFYSQANLDWYNEYYPIVPASVVYPKSSQEVGAAVKCAAQAGLKVQARSGGHSYANYCLGGTSGAVAIDMKYLNGVTYNPATTLASVGPGVLLQQLDDSLMKSNRVTPHGEAPQVGVGGHYTIGGLGPLGRQYGTASDQIVSAEVVLANGTIITASQKQNPDVLFALKGAGASFGIVTNFIIKTYEAPSKAVQFTYNVTVGNNALKTSVFKAFQTLITQPGLSRNFTANLIIFSGGVAVTGTFFGAEPAFDALNIQAQLPAGGVYKVNVINSAVGVLGQALLNGANGLGGYIPAHFYSKSLAIANTTLLSDDAIAALFAAIDASDTSGLLWFIIADQHGGAINDIPADATAYPFRNTVYFTQSYVIDALGNSLQKSRNFLDAVNAAVQTRTPGLVGAYPGYVDPYLPNAQSQYWLGNLPRLQRIKARVDPTNVFSNPQSVQVG